MQLQTTLTESLDIEHPILLAAMDVVADARLTVAVIEAGGYGFLGGGYGDEAWLRRELAVLAPATRERGRAFGVGFITWSLARKPHLLEIALEQGPGAVWLSFGDPAAFAQRIKAAGAKLVCQVQTEAMAKAALDAGADILVAEGAEAGGHGVTRGTLGAGARDRGPGGLACSGGGCGRCGRWTRSGGVLDAGRGRRGARNALLRHGRGRRFRGGQAAHRRGQRRRQPAQRGLRHLAQQRLAGSFRPAGAR